MLKNGDFYKIYLVGDNSLFNRFCLGFYVGIYIDGFFHFVDLDGAHCSLESYDVIIGDRIEL